MKHILKYSLDDEKLIQKLSEAFHIKVDKIHDLLTLKVNLLVFWYPSNITESEKIELNKLFQKEEKLRRWCDENITPKELTQKRWSDIYKALWDIQKK